MSEHRSRVMATTLHRWFHDAQARTNYSGVDFSETSRECRARGFLPKIAMLAGAAVVSTDQLYEHIVNWDGVTVYMEISSEGKVCTLYGGE